MEQKHTNHKGHETPKTSSEVTHGTPKVQVTVNHGQGYVWDPQDVWQLWREYRVVGSLAGTLPRHPHQSNTLGLPLKLLHEEVTLLLEEGLGETVQYKEMKERPSQMLKDIFNNHRDSCYREQKEAAARQRIDQVKKMAGKILEGKRKKFLMKQNKEQSKEVKQDTPGSKTEAFTLTIEEVIKEEEEKLQPLPPQHQVVEVFTRHPLLNHLTAEPCTWPYPITQHEKIKSKVFSDLWHQGLYLTSGIKFGGDFLVYSGNPHLYHAHAIVRCVAENQMESGEGCDLVAATRVAAATKKTFVLATLDHSGEVIYHSYHWYEDHEQEEGMESDGEEL